jgi:hypothetical protein
MAHDAASSAPLESGAPSASPAFAFDPPNLGASSPSFCSAWQAPDGAAGVFRFGSSPNAASRDSL